MLSVPMWARFMAGVVGEQPLQEIPWERPRGAKPSDTGGPLKKEFPPPPSAAGTEEGAPAIPAVAPPLPLVAPPSNLVRQKTVRVMGAPPRLLKPGETPAMAAPPKSKPRNQSPQPP
jgi:hypothetical protein